MARAVQRVAARRDFINHYVYLAENAGLDTAKRFREAVELTYAELAHNPGIGAPGKVRQGKHAGVRVWPVRNFEQVPNQVPNLPLMYKLQAWQTLSARAP